MCRVVVATRRLAPEREYAVFRALQFAQFTSTLFLEDADAAARGDRLGARASTPTRSSPPRHDPETEALFEQDRDEARTAAGGPTEFQDKSRQHRRPRALHGAEHQVHQRQGVTLEAGGFQSFEAYDVLIANLDHDARAAARPPRTPPRSCRRSRTA